MGLKGVIPEVETDLAWAEEALASDRPAAHEMALNEQGEDHAWQRSDHGVRRYGGPGALDLPAMVAGRAALSSRVAVSASAIRVPFDRKSIGSGSGSTMEGDQQINGSPSVAGGNDGRSQDRAS
jgi:hypothetical protein